MTDKIAGIPASNADWLDWRSRMQSSLLVAEQRAQIVASRRGVARNATSDQEQKWEALFTRVSQEDTQEHTIR